jgi:hypothetical protein
VCRLRRPNPSLAHVIFSAVRFAREGGSTWQLELTVP